MPASTGMPAIIAFCAISTEQRLVITHTPSANDSPALSPAPISLSSALCRPTSSRASSTAPSAVAQPAACTAPVARFSACRPPSSAIARWIAADVTRTPAPTGGATASATAASAAPHTPHPAWPGRIRARPSARYARSASGPSVMSNVSPSGPGRTVMPRTSASVRAIRSVTENPAPKSSMSSGVAIIIAYGTPLYSTLTATSSATSCGAHTGSAPSRSRVADTATCAGGNS